MKRKHVDTVFFAITLVLMGVVVFSMQPQKEILGPGNQNLAARAFSQPTVPNIEMISPQDKTTIYLPVQTFTYKLKAVDYDATCLLIVDDEIVATTEVYPGMTVEEKTSFAPGYYDWKVQCKLLDGRTISGIDNFLTVENYKNLDESFKVTGNVVDVGVNPVSYQASLIIVMIGIAGLIFALKPMKK